MNRGCGRDHRVERSVDVGVLCPNPSIEDGAGDRCLLVVDPVFDSLEGKPLLEGVGMNSVIHHQVKALNARSESETHLWNDCNRC